MRQAVIAQLWCFAIFCAYAQNAGAIPNTQVNTDLWDVAQGTTVTSTSGMVQDPANVLGKSFPSQVDSYFDDGKAAGFSHFIEFKTASPVTIRSLNVWAGDDRSTGNTGRRALTEFRLFGWNGIAFVPLIDNQITVPYAQQTPFGGDGALIVNQAINAFTSDTWRAEFVQPPAFSGTLFGPRVLEMDGFAEVPEPGISLLMLGAMPLMMRRRRRA